MELDNSLKIGFPKLLYNISENISTLWKRSNFQMISTANVQMQI